MEEHVFDVTIPSTEDVESIRKKLLALLISTFGEDVEVDIIDNEDDGDTSVEDEQ